MSLLDVFLRQEEILLTSLLAILPLLAAAILLLLPRLLRKMKTSSQQRKARRAQRQAERAALATLASRRAEQDGVQEGDGIEVAESAGSRPRASDEMAKGSAQKSSEANPLQASQPEAAPAPSPANSPAADTASDQPQQDAAGEEGVPSAIQEILDSVFDDDDLIARYEVLLRNVEPVDTADLALRCSDVAEQLRARHRRAQNER